MTTYYTSNDASTGFDAQSTGAIATGWTAAKGTWQVGTTNPTGAHTHTLGSTTKADGDVALLTSPAAVADMQLTVSQKVTVLPTTTAASGAAAPVIGVLLRTDSGYANGYTAVVGHSTATAGKFQVIIFKRVSSTYTQLLRADVAASFAVGDTLNIKAQAYGTTIRIRVWNASTSEPTTWDASITDSSVTSAGYAGLYYATDSGATGSASMGVDEVVLSDIPNAVTISPSNAGIVYSPYNWDTTSVANEAITINAGAYFRTMFTGATCALTFDMTNPLTPYPEIWYQIDGQGWQQATIAASVALTMPSATLSNSDIPFHFLEVVVKSTTETRNRWTAPSNTMVALTGIVLDAGASVQAPGAGSERILFYGDSITEGVRTLGESATNDTDRNDARAGWAFRLGQLLGAEVGIVGFGASGLTVTGSGNVPALPSSYNLLRAGVSRSFSPAPNLIVLHEGTNDGSTSTVSAMTSVLNGLLSACPNTPILVLRPFNGTTQAANLQAAIAACSNPALVTYKDTSGIVLAANGLDSLGLHPSGPNNLGIVAPALAPALRQALLGYPTASSVAATDSVLVQQNGVTKFATIAQVRAAA